MYSLGKNERLKSRKEINTLFARHNVCDSFPMRIFFSIENKNEFEIKAGFVCGKKYFKQAVRHNRAKRLMREAYRTKKEFLEKTARKKKKSVHLFFLYANNEPSNYKQVQTAMTATLQRIEKLIGNQ
jgi:ribonuclease P protein component